MLAYEWWFDLFTHFADCWETSLHFHSKIYKGMPWIGTKKPLGYNVFPTFNFVLPFFLCYVVKINYVV